MDIIQEAEDHMIREIHIPMEFSEDEENVEEIQRVPDWTSVESGQSPIVVCLLKLLNLTWQTFSTFLS